MLLGNQNTYFSVDIEAAGPVPGKYALLSIGACTLTDPMKKFYVELKPDSLEILPEAQAVHGFDIYALLSTGREPSSAMSSFADWVENNTQPGRKPVFVGFNAPFDWMFINIYFYKYLGYNPFGHSALDIKSLYMGCMGVEWDQTSFEHISAAYDLVPDLKHHALEDAVQQAELFRRIVEKININRQNLQSS